MEPCLVPSQILRLVAWRSLCSATIMVAEEEEEGREGGREGKGVLRGRMVMLLGGRGTLEARLFQHCR